MTDIVWLLRNDCPCISDIGCAQELCNQAAAEIERLRAALRPFACKCSVKGMGAGGNCTRGTGECDCWNARTALEGK